MKLVRTPGRAQEPESPAELPPASLLESVRDLPGRFPAAGLRRVTLVRASELDGASGPRPRRVWLALECLQVTGSFKVRGALVAMADALESQGSRSFVAASAGNHGAGVAHAARVLGLSVTVVVPPSAPLAKRARMEACGATVRLSSSPHYDVAEREALQLASELGVPFLSPYDDLRVLSGNGASLAFEIARALGRTPEAVLAPLGGSGLVTGLASGFAHLEGEAPGARPRVWGAQSEASPAFALSLERGSAVTELLTGETLAEGLEGGISEAAFARARAVVEGVFVAPEAQILEAMIWLYRALGLIVEGSAAVALAPVLPGIPDEIPEGDLVVVLTGRNVDPHRLRVLW